MTKDELLKLTKAELNARLKEIGVQSKTAEGEALDALVAESEMIADILDQAAKRERLAKVADNAEDPTPAAVEKSDDADSGVKAFEKRGANLKAGKNAVFSAGIASPNVKDSLSVEQTAPVKHTAPDLNQTVNPVSALVDMVKAVTLQGGETYERGFVKDYGADGAGGTAEGGNYNGVEPVFGYTTIEKQKITAYTEEPEEMQKLPNADYDSVVEGSVSKAIRRYLSRQILVGDGSTSKLKGIFFNPVEASERVIDPNTDIEIAEIDDGTLDEIIYSFGGDEEVEGVATLILNKQDLKAFAKLRDKQGRKVYTIVNNGQTGTIDGVPFVINSACAAISNVATDAGAYVMAYGYLQNYELAIFSDIDVRRSDDYKFKSGQTAFRASMFAGGSVAAWNGFIRAKKASF
ncbi:MAG: phage major capsid protein [Clostridiales bacterium]|nr:phage major capsid protein [Clostridiales bacterium]